MSYLSSAHARLLHAIAQTKPVEISLSPKASEFEAQKDHLKELAFAVDDYLHSIGIDAAENSHVIKADFSSLLAGAMDDRGVLSQFDDEAEAIREATKEFNSDRRGWSQAQSVGVD